VAELRELPDKPYFKAGEVCKYTDTQPYVLSFWESEFPQLAPEKSPGGQTRYTREDIEMILRIKELLYDEEHTIADARERLDAERGGRGGSSAARAMAQPQTDAPAARQATEPRRPEAGNLDVVSRERYEDALDEIAHLRLQLREAETHARRATSAQAKAEERAERHRGRAEKAVSTLERLQELL